MSLIIKLGRLNPACSTSNSRPAQRLVRAEALLGCTNIDVARSVKETKYGALCAKIVVHTSGLIAFGVSSPSHHAACNQSK